MTPEEEREIQERVFDVLAAGDLGKIPDSSSGIASTTAVSSYTGPSHLKAYATTCVAYPSDQEIAKTLARFSKRYGRQSAAMVQQQITQIRFPEAKSVDSIWPAILFLLTCFSLIMGLGWALFQALVP
jgi:hypothetical protein